MSEVAASTEVEEQKPPVEGEEKTEKVEKTEEQKKTEARNYSQEEVDKILAKVRKNERYRTRKEVEAYWKGRTESQGEPKKEEPKEGREPVRGDFETYEEFIEARADFRARKAAREETTKAETENKEKSAQEARHKRAVEFQTKVKEKYPDIEERIEEVGDMPMYVGVQEAISESPLGPEIFNELLNNPKEFERLTQMSEPAAIREIGKLEARLEGKTSKAETKETKTASKAPAPIDPPAGGPSASDDSPSDKDDMETWMRKERARLAKLRKQG